MQQFVLYWRDGKERVGVGDRWLFDSCPACFMCIWTDDSSLIFSCVVYTNYSLAQCNSRQKY